MTLLQSVLAGKEPIVVGLFLYRAEKEQAVCKTIDEAKEYLGRDMETGWRWSLSKTMNIDNSGAPRPWNEINELRNALDLPSI